VDFSRLPMFSESSATLFMCTFDGCIYGCLEGFVGVGMAMGLGEGT